MISASTSDDFKNITKVSFLDAKKVFYPLKYVLEKRDVVFDDDQALIITNLVPEDLKYPASVKLTDAGMLRDYKIDVSVYNQSAHTEAQLEDFDHKKVIVVLHHAKGKFIIGCNEMPLTFSFNDDNTTNPALDNGYTIVCRGNAYYLKVSI